MESKEPKEEKETYINTGGTISGVESFAYGTHVESLVSGHNFILTEPSVIGYKTMCGLTEPSVIGVRNSETIPTNTTVTASNTFALDGRHSVKSNFKLNNMETKKVTLNNGTVLEVGKKYQNKNLDLVVEVLAIHGEEFWGLDSDNDGCIWGIDADLLPHTEPTPQKEWKTFLIEVMHHKTGTFYKFPILAESEENARKIHPKAISITEIKLNIEPVNS